VAELEYLNFDLEIEKADGGYRSHALASPAGEARAALGPIDGLPAGDAEGTGAALFDALFREDVLGCFRRSLDIATAAGKGLRIRLRLAETPELADLPWELMRDRARGVYLALSRETPLVRYLDLPEPADTRQPELRLRVLAVIASPTDYPALDVEREYANLKAALADLEAHSVVQVDRLEPPTLEALQQQLLQREYHILHFLGHGTFDDEAGDSVLLLCGEDGRGAAVTGETFAALVRDQRSLRLALLNACEGALGGEGDPYSGVAQRLVRGGVPAVIAMRSAISDRAAVALARSFYGALAAGAAVDAAMAEARKTLYSGGFAGEWATAVLYMRAADGRLWRPDPKLRQRRVRLALAAAGAALAVALLALVIWSQIGPTRMDPANTLNIALLDPSSGRGESARREETALIRGWLADEMQRAIDAEPDERVALWHDGLPRAQKRNRLPRLDGETSEQREDSARRLADEIGADVILSTRIEEEGGKRVLQPEFFVFSRLAPEANESIGRYAFGKPIPLPADLSTADAVSRDSIAKQLGQRAKLLDWLLLALRADVLGRHDEALALLEAAQQELGLQGLEDQQVVARSAALSGLDTLYYFLGRERLFLGRYEQAEADAWTAAQINGDDPRPWIILGGALMRQSEAAPPDVALEADGLLARAEQAYAEAVRASPEGSTANSVARLALGNLRVARGAALYATGQANGEARAAFEQAVAELTPLLTPLELEKQHRMLAQCRSYLGAARLYAGNLALQEGDEEAAKRLLAEAEAHFSACIEEGDKLPEDATLRDQIVGALCAPARQQAAQALVELGGE
jgi:tetratricopeptide (TPR) repeat protein